MHTAHTHTNSEPRATRATLGHAWPRCVLEGRRRHEVAAASECTRWTGACWLAARAACCRAPATLPASPPRPSCCTTPPRPGPSAAPPPPPPLTHTRILTQGVSSAAGAEGNTAGAACSGGNAPAGGTPTAERRPTAAGADGQRLVSVVSWVPASFLPRPRVRPSTSIRKTYTKMVSIRFGLASAPP